MRLAICIVGGALLLAACSQRDAAQPPPEFTTFPHVVNGVLEVSVEEGEVAADDISDINFGELTVGEYVHMVAITAAVVRASGVGRDDLVGGKSYRVTLSGVDPLSESVGVTFYQVSKLEPQE